MEELVRFFGTAEGRVQGVGFRMFVQQHAMELGLTGWVRNMEDGSVTMEIQGRQEKIDRLTDFIRQGNFFIRVSSLSLESRSVLPNEDRFVVRY